MERTCENCRMYATNPCADCRPENNFKNWEEIIEGKKVYSLNGYQRDALRTAGSADINGRLGNFGLGIAGEAGEVADYIKKVVYHKHPMDKDKLCKELGDVLWYVATLADTADLTLEEVARRNINKLRERYPDGFDPERSINRKSSE